MALVTLNVYDITNTKSDFTNSTIQHLNALTKDTLNAGGIFHGGIEVHGYEYSYGYCEDGTGVYPCQPKMNSAYVFRESIPLGVTSADATKVRAIVAVMKASWPGSEYELFSKNCNTFCEAFTRALGVPLDADWNLRKPYDGDDRRREMMTMTMTIMMMTMMTMMRQR